MSREVWYWPDTVTGLDAPRTRWPLAANPQMPRDASKLSAEPATNPNAICRKFRIQNPINHPDAQVSRKRKASTVWT
jgi:hypothetical protein